MSKKTAIRADVISSSCKMLILSTVAKLKGIKSMDIDAENCTLTVIGPVDPVAIVLKLKKKNLAAVIVSVEDDKPKDPEPPAPPPPPEPTTEDDPCRCREACVQACVEACEKGCVPGCYYSPCLLPNCCYYTAFRQAPYGYGWYW